MVKKNDPNNMLSPIKTKKPPIIIGFRTKWYILIVISFFVGFQGAIVPSPFKIKRDIDKTIKIQPKAMKKVPRIKENNAKNESNPQNSS
jgi:cytochrome c biogenesis protein ResB